MMIKYNNFTVEDLVWDLNFRQWVLSPTLESEAAWTDWMEHNVDHKKKVDQARQIVLSLKVVESPLQDEEIRQIVNKSVSRLNQPVLEHDNETPLQAFYQKTWFRIAASVTILLVAGWLFRSNTNLEESRTLIAAGEVFTEPKHTFVKKVNETTEPMTVELADKSTVVLASGSYIQYEANFQADKREVFLVGEAFFDVAKNPVKPFFVYTNELVTKVLGTSFTIKALESSREVTVEVKSGRVSVFTKSDPHAAQKAGNKGLAGLVLLPNQKMIFKRDEVRMVKTLVEKPQIILPKDQIPLFLFEDTPVVEVLKTLEKAYGVEIVYDAALLKDCPLTATLNDQPLNDKLMIICRAIEATYEIVDGQIIIHGDGC
jgi:transmembrane sensor